MADIFDWEAFRTELAKDNPTRDSAIERAWLQFADGHSSFEDKSSAEVQECLYMFRAGWILSDLLKLRP